MSGDTLIIHQYPDTYHMLQESNPINTWKDLRKGDCIICFSKNKVS